MKNKVAYLIPCCAILLLGCSNGADDSSSTLPIESTRVSESSTSIETTATDGTANDETEDDVPSTEETILETESPSEAETTPEHKNDDIPTPEKKEGMGNVNILKDDTEIAPESTYRITLLIKDAEKAYSDYYDEYRNKSGISLNEYNSMEEKPAAMSSSMEKLYTTIHERMYADKEEWMLSIGASDLVKLATYTYEFDIKGSDIDNIYTGRCNYSLLINTEKVPTSADLDSYYGNYSCVEKVYHSLLLGVDFHEPGVYDVAALSLGDSVILFPSDGSSYEYHYSVTTKKEFNHIFGIDGFDFTYLSDDLKERILSSDAVLETDNNDYIFLTDDKIYLYHCHEMFEFLK